MDMLFKLLQQMREVDASDLLLSNGMPPSLRINGQLAAIGGEVLSPLQIESVAKLLFNAPQQQVFAETLECNVGISFPGLGRFRVNGFHQRGSVALAIRAVPTSVPGFAALGLPDSLQDIAMQKFDGILYGDDVPVFIAAAIVDHGRQRSRRIRPVAEQRHAPEPARRWATHCGWRRGTDPTANR